jgi:hypothetical protein
MTAQVKGETSVAGEAAGRGAAPGAGSEVDIGACACSAGAAVSVLKESHEIGKVSSFQLFPVSGNSGVSD